MSRNEGMLSVNRHAIGNVKLLTVTQWEIVKGAPSRVLSCFGRAQNYL